MLKRSGNSMFGISEAIRMFEVLAARRKGAAAFTMFGIEVCACLPEFGEELFVESGLQVADAFAPARALLCAEHSLDHLDVMVTPEREELVVRDESFR